MNTLNLAFTIIAFTGIAASRWAISVTTFAYFFLSLSLSLYGSSHYNIIIASASSYCNCISMDLCVLFMSFGKRTERKRRKTTSLEEVVAVRWGRINSKWQTRSAIVVRCSHHNSVSNRTSNRKSPDEPESKAKTFNANHAHNGPPSLLSLRSLLLFSFFFVRSFAHVQSTSADADSN